MSTAPPGGPVELCGRVELRAGAVFVADAFTAVPVQLPEALALGEGELVVLRGAPAAGGLRVDAVVERHAPALQTERGERGRLRSVGPNLRGRAHVLRAIRSFFDDRGFLEVETPALVPCPGLDVHLDAYDVGLLSGADGDRPTLAGHLITSPEYQMKRLLVGGVHRCYQLAHCFRRGELGDRHNPEFSMLEWYRAFASVEDLLDDTEALVRHVATELNGGPMLPASASRARAGIDLGPPFERLTVGGAFERYAGIDADDAIRLASDDEDRFFRLLVEAVEPALERAPRPVFLLDYPAPFASLARLRSDDPRVAERFELYIGGFELCNGFGELTDPVEQRRRFEHDQRERRRLAKPVYPLDERFLEALAEGMPPSAGNALGVDRLVALCVGADRIGDVQAFPSPWL